MDPLRKSRGIRFLTRDVIFEKIEFQNPLRIRMCVRPRISYSLADFIDKVKYRLECFLNNIMYLFHILFLNNTIFRLLTAACSKQTCRWSERSNARITFDTSFSKAIHRTRSLAELQIENSSFVLEDFQILTVELFGIGGDTLGSKGHRKEVQST